MNAAEGPRSGMGTDPERSSWRVHYREIRPKMLRHTSVGFHTADTPAQLIPKNIMYRHCLQPGKGEAYEDGNTANGRDDLCFLFGPD